MLLLMSVVVASPACATFEDKPCTTIFQAYDITMTRTLDVAATDVDRRKLQACVDDGCMAVSEPGPDGRAKFGPLGGSPSGELALSTAPDGRQIVAAKFRLGEREGTFRLRVIAQQISSARTLVAEGTVTFTGGSCHPSPTATDV